MARKSRSRARRTSAPKPSFSFECYPFLFSQIDMHHCEDGNKIIMPPSALEELMLMKKISYPMTFKIINPFLKNYSHCGVLEFSGEEGCVFLPNWMMNSLLLDQGQAVNIEYTELPKGQSLKIQPHSSEFVMNLSDPEQVMEKIFKDFACVTIGDTIMVNHENQSYYIDIVETRPHEAVSLFETDCELEFERPLDYKEPEKIKPKVEQVEEVKDTINVEKDAVFNQVEEVKDTINVEKDAVFKPFTGVSRRLDGQVSVSAPPPVVAAEDDKELVADSRRHRHARIVVCGLDAISSAAKEKAKTEETEDVKGKTKENTGEKKFQPFTGKKYTLSSC